MGTGQMVWRHVPSHCSFVLTMGNGVSASLLVTWTQRHTSYRSVTQTPYMNIWTPSQKENVKILQCSSLCNFPLDLVILQWLFIIYHVIILTTRWCDDAPIYNDMKRNHNTAVLYFSILIYFLICMIWPCLSLLSEPIINKIRMSKRKNVALQSNT